MISTGHSLSLRGMRKMARVEAEEVVHVAVFVLRVVDVLAPLHELAIAANAIRREFIEDFLPLFYLFNCYHSPINPSVPPSEDQQQRLHQTSPPAPHPMAPLSHLSFSPYVALV